MLPTVININLFLWSNNTKLYFLDENTKELLNIDKNEDIAFGESLNLICHEKFLNENLFYHWIKPNDVYLRTVSNEKLISTANISRKDGIIS